MPLNLNREIVYAALRFLLIAIFPSSLGAQGMFSQPNQVNMTAEELVGFDPEEEERYGGLSHEFDRLGNRLRPLGAITYLIPVSPSLDYQSRTVARDIGSDSLIFYKPIIPLQENPYNMRPAVDVLREIGPYDFLRPELRFTAQHESDLQIGLDPTELPDFSYVVGSQFKIASAVDRPSPLNIFFTYTPLMTTFLDNPQLSEASHDGILRLTLPIKRITLASATTMSITTQPNTFVGNLSRTEDIGQAISFGYRISPKTNTRLAAGIRIGKLTQVIKDDTVVPPPIDSTNVSLTSSTSYTKNEKLAATLLISGIQADQSSASIGAFNLGNESTLTFLSTVGITYLHSEKLTLGVGFGGNMIQSDPFPGFETAPNYEFLATYQPHPRWTFTLNAGVVSTAPTPETGIGSDDTFFSATLTKIIYRRMNIGLGYQTITRTTTGSNSLLSALDPVKSTRTSANLHIPLRRRTNLIFAYEYFEAGTFGSFTRPPRTTFSITVRYQL